MQNAIMLNVIMLNVIMLNVIMLNVIMLNVIMLNVFMLNDIMVSVVAPSEHLFFVTYDKLKCYITLARKACQGQALQLIETVYTL